MKDLIKQIRNLNHINANSIIKQISGIVDYFSSEEEKKEFITANSLEASIVCEDRVSYGDWQTPESLADKVCEKHLSKYGNPDIVIEPTCGRGSFVLSALHTFTALSEIHALEINRQYTTELKLKLLIDALNNPSQKHPDIYIYNANFFDFDFSAAINNAKKNNWNLAIVGNPPWVTNSRQGRTNSKNVPLKQNSFGLKGIEAITGKSNFDISESITLTILNLSQFNKGGISFLLKNSVIRSIIAKQKSEPIHIGDINQETINAAHEFNVSVDASCFSARLDCAPSMRCNIKNFYDDSPVNEYGWVNNSFVANTSQYLRYSKYDSHSTYIWRSGIKHDCASVLELTFSNGIYTNGYGEAVQIEDDLIYPLLKSSDVKSYKPNKFRKYVIVPQCKVGEDTSALKHTYPLAYSYLSKYEDDFSKRKSSIYKGKDKFSIFGIGEYSFSPYKIIVSSLYKDINFVLVSHFEGKPVIVDDTCYQLDFDNKEEAMHIYDALHSDAIQSLLESLIFLDAKRVVTKSLLMRIDLVQFCIENGIIINTQRFINSRCRQLSLFD